MTTPIELFRNHLLVDEEVIVELPTGDDAEHLLQLLRTAKYRNCKEMEKLGMSDVDPLADKIIKCTLLEATSNGVKVKYHTAPATGRSTKFEFKILQETDNAAGSQ